jgi:hypothetical protein
MSYAILAMEEINSENRDTQCAGATSPLSGSERNCQGFEVQEIINNNKGRGTQPVAEAKTLEDRQLGLGSVPGREP